MSLSTKLSLDLLPRASLAYEHTLTKYNLPNKYQLPSAEDFWGLPGKTPGYLFHLPAISHTIL